MSIIKQIPVNKTQCATCPFRKEGWTYLQGLLASRALGTATPICHSTGPKALVPKKQRIHSEEHACRGARNLQIAFFHSIGFLYDRTDEAWDDAVKEINRRELEKTTRNDRKNRKPPSSKR